MKKIFITFAATAALASCVEEKSLDPQPQQPVSDNVVTIKAVTTDTKTVLSDGDVRDGVSVLWENNDAIKVVFTGTEKNYESKFTTLLDSQSDKADFTGSLDSEVTAENCGSYGYAIYPYHAQISPDSDNKLYLPLMTVQNGKIVSATEELFIEQNSEWVQQQTVNYSYAAISLDNIKSANSTEAYFRNVMSLVRVNVPAGVKKVTISSVNTADASAEEQNNFPLTGKARFQYDNSTKQLVMLEDEWNEQDKFYEVVLKNADDSELNSSVSYDLLVYPGTHSKLTIKVEGNDVSCTKSINREYVFEASECYSLDLSDIFAMGSKTVYAFPDGKPFEIPVTTTFDDITVEIPADASWLTVTPEAKGSLHNDVISLTGAENTTVDRSATVTLKSGSTTLSTVNVIQKAYVEELINEYAESYGSTNGTLKIEVSDDQSQAVYKVTICGHTLYADFADQTLTVYDNKKQQTLTVAADYSSITATDLQIQDVIASSYSAIISKGEVTLTAEEEALLGYYDETWTYEGNSGGGSKGMMIEKSDEGAFGQFIITCLTVGGSYFKGYAQMTGDEITLKVGKQLHSTFNKIGEAILFDLNTIVFTVNNDGSLSFSSWSDANSNFVTNYVATKSSEQGEGESEGDESSSLTALVGSWNETFDYYQGWGDPVTQTGVVTVTLEGDKLLFTNMFNTVQWGNTKSGKYYGVLSDDGKNILISDVNSSSPHAVYGPIQDSNYNPTTLSLAIDNNQITIASAFNGYILDYTATKQ